MSSHIEYRATRRLRSVAGHYDSVTLGIGIGPAPQNRYNDDVDREAVIRKLQTNMPTFRRYGVTRMAVFGSIARNEATDASDLDLLVRLAEDHKTFKDYMDLKFAIEDLFPAATVDLVLEETLKPVIRDRVLAEAQDVT